MTGAVFTEADFRGFLDDISRAFIAKDIRIWRRRLRLPFSLVTAESPVTLRSEADVERNFAIYLDASRAMGLDFVYREALKAEHCEDGTVLATYRTHLMRTGQRITDPYTSTALLHPGTDGWRMSAILNARGHCAWTGQTPSNSGELR